MFNDRLSTEAARERIKQRMQEVETYGLQKRLGYSDRGNAKLIFVIVMLITVGAVALLL
jgi:hypothetical protein